MRSAPIHVMRLPLAGRQHRRKRRTLRRGADERERVAVVRERRRPLETGTRRHHLRRRAIDGHSNDVPAIDVVGVRPALPAKASQRPSGLSVTYSAMYLPGVSSSGSPPFSEIE